MIVIKVAKDKDETLWKSFISKHPLSHHAFSWEWRSIIKKLFSHSPYYLIAIENRENQDCCVGILPFFIVKSFIFGKAAISVPYLNGGGVIAENESIEHALIQKAIKISKKHAVRYVELRSREVLNLPEEDFVLRTHKVSMRLNTTDSPENIFNSFPAKLRSQIKRPTKSGLYATISTNTDLKAVNSFYQVFSKNMRDLGTPVYSKKLFFETFAKFNSTARIVIVWNNKTPVAAGMTLGFGSSVEIPWASANRNFNRFSPNMLLYWEAIKNASIEGYSFFDFGRSSPNSGPHKFKKQWGSEQKTLFWYYKLIDGDIPDINPNSKKFSTLVNTWKHMPITLTKILGPFITKSLP